MTKLNLTSHFKNLLSVFAPTVFVLSLSGCMSGSQPAAPSLSQSFSVAQISLISYDTSQAKISLKGNLSGLTVTDLTTVSFYSDSLCSSAKLGQSTSQDFSKTGTTLTVSSTKDTSIYAQTNTDTTCAYITTWSPSFDTPLAPTFLTSNPVSPSASVSSPLIMGNLIGTITTVKLYSDSNCSTLVGSGSATDFSTNGIIATLQPNSTTSIYAVAIEPFGKKSNCTLLTSYTHNVSTPAAPTLTSVTPASPSRTSTTPTLIGQVSANIATVALFNEPSCSTPLASGSAHDFATTGLQITVQENSTSRIYVQGTSTVGLTSACLYLTTFVSDTIPPTAPTYTSADPVSPTRLTIYPAIKGTVSDDTVSLKFFKDSGCSQLLSTGSAVQFKNAGVNVTIAGNTVTKIYAQSLDQAGNASACTYLTDYENNTIAPDPPVFSSFFPASPNNLSVTPLVSGVSPASAVTVSIFSDEHCTTQVGTGTAAAFSTTGIQATLQPNTVSQLYGNATDAMGNISDCGMLAEYAHSTVIPAAPVWTNTTPPSPSNMSTTPYISGTVTSVIATVNLFSDSTCTTSLGSGSKATYTTNGVVIGVPANSTTNIYANAIDVYNNQSPCVPLTTYIHDNIPPAAPSFNSASPLSPNNTSFTPTIKGVASADTAKITFYDSSSCLSKFGTGNGSDFATTGITITVPTNKTNTIYAKSFDAAGNGSACTFLTNYVYDDLKPGAPNYKSVTPMTPSYNRNVTLIGTVASSVDFEPTSTINIYSNSTCTNLITTTTPSIYIGAGVNFLVNSNATTTLYGQSVDIVGNLSKCNHLIDYVHSDKGPTGLSANASSNGAVNLSWNGDNNASYYTVKRSLYSGGPYVIISPMNMSTAFTDNTVSANTTYYYVVNSANATGISNDSAEVSVNSAPPSPVAPFGLSASPSNQTVQVSWIIDSTHLTFNLYRSSQAGGPYSLVATAIAANTYVDSGLTNDVSYYYVLSAVNPSGVSGFSSEISATPRANPPAPTNLQIRRTIGITNVITWTAPPYYNKFNLKRGGTSAGINTYKNLNNGVITYTDASCPGYGSYAACYYGVSATWGTGESSVSNVLGISRITPPTLSSYPGANEVTLSWTSDALSMDYTLMRSTQAGGPYTIISNHYSGTTYVDSTTSNGTIYYYVVYVNYTSDLVGGYSNEAAAFPGAFANSNPTNLVVYDSNYQANLVWTSPSQFNYFNIYRASSIGGPYAKINVSPVNSNQYIDTNPGLGINYYKVTATWSSAETGYSNVVSYRNGYPATLAATGSGTDITLSWASVSGASTYNVARSNSYTGPFTIIDSSSTGTSYVDSSALAGQGYYYVVSANFGDGTTGQNSPIASAYVGSSTIPTGLTITSLDSSSVTLNWIPVNGASSYKLYKSSTAGGPYTFVSASSSTPAIISSLISNNAYYFVVTSMTGSNESGRSNEVSATIVGQPSAPTASIGNNSVALNWGSVFGVVDYSVLRSSDGVNFTTLATGVASTNYTDTTALNGNLYFYKYQANFAAGAYPIISAASIGVTPGVTPSAPGNISVSANGTGVSLVLDWAPISTATSYKIYYSTTNGGPYSFLQSTNSYSLNSVTGLTANTSYYFVVTALNGSLESGYSPQVSAKTMLTPAAPSVTVQNNTSVQISWSAVNCGGSNAISYDVLRSTDAYNFSTIATGIATTNYSDSSFGASQVYYYEYLPYCAGSVPGDYSSISIGITPTVAPNAPQNLIAISSATNTATLSWVPSPLASGYRVYQSSTSGGPYSLVSSSVSASVSVGGLTTGTYYFVVTAYNSNNVESGQSNQAQITMSLSGPASLSATPGNKVIQLSWSAVGGASSYTVKRSISSSGPFGSIATGLVTTSYNDTNIEIGTTYYYVVDAIDASSVSSEDSPVASATAAASVNLVVPIELVDSPLASSTSSTTFERTRTSLDQSAYDGTVSYSLEVVGSNSDSVSRSVSILNAAGTTVSSVSIPANTTSLTRFSTALTPTNSSDTYRVSVAATTSNSQVQIYTARILVKQQNATKTKIYIPLTSSLNAPSNNDLNGYIETTTATSVNQLTSASIFQRNSTAYQTLNEYNAWELEALISSSGAAIGSVQLYDFTKNATVLDTQTLFASNSIQLAKATFDEGTTNFDSTTESDLFQVALTCYYNCTSGSVNLYKAGLWINLHDLSKADIIYRNGLASVVSSSSYLDNARALINLADFSNPIFNFQAVLTPPNAGSVDVSLIRDSTDDSGVTNVNAIASSTLNFSGASKAIIQTTGSLAVPNANRLIPLISPSGGSTTFNSSAIVISVSP